MHESEESQRSSAPSFWRWFFRDPERSGWRKFANWWLLLHLFVGLALARFVPGDLKTAASTVLLPLVGVLIGLSFAWAGNAQALLQTDEIEELAEYHRGGFEEFVYTYQAAILVILSCVVLWGLAGLGIFDLPCGWDCPSLSYFMAKAFLFFVSSITMRECWHVVLGAQLMLLARNRIKRSK